MEQRIDIFVTPHEQSELRGLPRYGGRCRNQCGMTILLLAACLLSACASTVDKLQNVGKQPPETPLADPTRKADYEPLSWPMPEGVQQAHTTNSLWQPGARAFFRDQRAARVGDILHIVVNINDQILTDNESQGSRQTTDSASFPALGGVQAKVAHLFSSAGQASNYLDTTSARDNKSTGKITRQDQIQTEVSAMIKQVLPNGNFVIEGSQEILMNYEIRMVGIKGVVRPQDLGPDDKIDSSLVADARITYSGRGQMMDMQQARWGSQVVDILSPF